MSPATPAEKPPAQGGPRHTLMAGVALLFTAQLSVLLPHGDSGEALREGLLANAWFTRAMLALWGVIGLEAVLGLFSAPDAWSARIKRLLIVCAAPPLRMTLATSTPPGWLWVPRFGWQPAGPGTTLKLERRLAIPMIVLTLLVVPVLVAELGFGETLDNHPRLAEAVHYLTSLIWLGFAAEFIWMVSATPEKAAYCLRHWVNLLIILLPLVAFLRFLRLFRFARMFKAGKLLRAYRLRGLWMRVWRTALLFNLIERLQERNPEKYRAVLEKKIRELEAEVDRLKEKLALLKGRE
ncbi:MAG TPA: potassium channel protein - like protein [Verrucomicrobiales bacterium]|nr:potassium channel protein - like protein [Verrucomicrobiales bacterium]